MMHNPYPLSVIPHPMLSYLDNLTLLQRIENIAFHALEGAMIRLYHYPLQVCLLQLFAGKYFCVLINLIFHRAKRDIYNEYFRDGKPSFEQTLHHSVALMLLNTHFSINFPQSNLPNMVRVVGDTKRKYCSSL